ncbi:Outer membrane usher protein HtrE [Cupriavidus laharis]|uniref:Outer membrane usher protein HtrE n=2 Tax=Cupriavidus laharis TaxID=151654 RepID=A0ABN7YP16_9BURK|nr:Outer membrane usher protein HtrE [Cupriavidus laharis]
MLVSAGALAANSDSPKAGAAAEVEFNDLFLHQPGGSPIDFSRFNKGNVVMPGSYRAELYVNQAWLGRIDVQMREIAGKDSEVLPCFDEALLDRVGADLGRLAPETIARVRMPEACVPLHAIIHGATASFDSGEQRLDVSVPQAALSRQARGYVDPRYWNDGVTAATVQYNGSVYQTRTAGYTATQGYLGLGAGFNTGPWRFRHKGSLSSDQGTARYQSVQTSLQRSVISLRSQLVLGDAFTDGTVFDSVGFRGVQLASDDRMQPESQRGYAPRVHGIANSNARVQVRQNGNLIYETTVAAGPFEIDDLYPTGYGGDLEVVVTEADGSVHVSRVPYAAAVNALRPGVTRYGVTAGQYRNAGLQGRPAMLQATVQHGFTNMVTGYGGIVVAEGYLAAVGGAALNTAYGAFGADLTHAGTRLATQPDRNGYSARLSYSKLVEPTGTNVSVAAYRYSSSGYLGMTDAMTLRELERRGMQSAMRGILRSQLQLTLNQRLRPGYGSFYLSGAVQGYWNRGGTDTQFQLGYNNSYKSLNYGVAASRQFSLSGRRWENRIMLNIGIPLGKGQHAPYAMTGIERDASGTVNLQQSVTGSLGVDNAFSYGVNAGYASGGRPAASLAANAAYLSPVAALTASAGKGSNYSQVSAGISGGIVAYAGGVSFTPTMGETLAIVEAADAAGARLVNGSGLRVDPWGRAVVPALVPFSRNQVEIDPKGLPVNVDLDSTLQQVAPTAGAVVAVRFETADRGRPAVIRTSTVDGKPLPFGAEVRDDQGANIGTVGQGGRIVARGLRADQGQLTARWGKTAQDTCRLDYALPATGRRGTRIDVIEVQCH